MSAEIKILIVEDNRSDAELLQWEIKRAGLSFSSVVVETREAYELALDNFRPGIILSDFSLPQFDGITAFHLKKKKYPEVPFIIVSATVGEEAAVELIRTGITDYALKDKLFTIGHKITRALHEAEEAREKENAFEKLKQQNKKLAEIAFLQSHQVRAPVASMLGLFKLFNFENANDPLNSEVLKKLQNITVEFDKMIREIVEKTVEIRNAH